MNQFRSTVAKSWEASSD